jgi:hypothetical protein
MWRPYRSGRHSATELTLASPQSSRTVPGMASRGGLAEQRRDMIPRQCQRAGVVRIRLCPRRPRRARAFNALVGRVGARGHEPGEASSEAENHPRGRQPHERGGESPEGA